jgi:ribosomal protein S18 acetylase RimI-like enzyme
MSDSDISAQWVSNFDKKTARAIVSLVDFATHDDGTLGNVFAMTAAEAESFLSNLHRRVVAGESYVLLCHVGGKPAALGVFSLNGMQNCVHRAELSKGVVNPAFRGRYLVDRMFRECLQLAEALSIEQLVLDVREGSRAHALWRHFGFTTYGVLEDYARVHGVRHRGHYMVQSVASLRERLSPKRRHLDHNEESRHV